MDGQRAAAEGAVVVGVDGSDTALHAVRWAAREAEQRGAPLRIVHAAPYAVDNSRGERRAAGILTQAHTVAGQTAPAVRTCTEQLAGSMPKALVDTAATAQLLVVGMSGGTRFDDVLVHSLALDTCAAAACPVVIVRGGHGPQSEALPVVVGLQEVSADAAAVTVAFDDARRHGCALTVLHTLHDGGPARKLRPGHDSAEVEREIANALTPWRIGCPDVPVDVRVLSGSAAGHLLEASVSARLLVVGTHARGAATRLVLGSTSRTVARLSSCPVVVVPRTARPAGSASSTTAAAPAS